MLTEHYVPVHGGVRAMHAVIDVVEEGDTIYVCDAEVHEAISNILPRRRKGIDMSSLQIVIDPARVERMIAR
jgi:GTP cyclohydrolase FolE2